jgi:hypothetical protein
MSRFAKIILGLTLIGFVLACNLLTRPVRDVENLASTAQALASAIPIETLQALPSSMPDIDGLPTGMPDIGNLADPQGEPLTEWNGIPISPAATAGEETTGLYSYKANGTISELSDFYKSEMERLGWQELFSLPDTGTGAILTYQQDDHVATITISNVGENVVLVWLTYQ